MLPIHPKKMYDKNKINFQIAIGQGANNQSNKRLKSLTLCKLRSFSLVNFSRDNPSSIAEPRKNKKSELKKSVVFLEY